MDSIKLIQLNGQCKRKNSCFDKVKLPFKKLDVFNFRPTFYFCILRIFLEPIVFDGVHRTSSALQGLHSISQAILFIALYSEMAAKSQRIEKTEEFINFWTYSWIFVTFFQMKFLQKRAISSQLISSDQPGPNPDGSL